jgi:hypothetical protein
MKSRKQDRWMIKLPNSRGSWLQWHWNSMLLVLFPPSLLCISLTFQIAAILVLYPTLPVGRQPKHRQHQVHAPLNLENSKNQWNPRVPNPNAQERFWLTPCESDAHPWSKQVLHDTL